MREAIKPGLIALLLMGLLFSFIPIVHGYTLPNTARLSVQSVGTTTLTLTVQNSGDLIVAAIQMQDGSSAGDTSVSVISITGNENLVLAKAQHLNVGANCSAGNCFDDEIWSALAASSGSDLFTIIFSQNMGAGGAQIQMYDFAGGSFVAAASGTAGSACSAACGTSYSTSTSNTINGGDLAIGSIWTSCEAANTLAAGPHYIKFSPTSLFEGASEYGDPATPPTGTTNYPFTCNAAQSTVLDAGAIFGTSVVTSTVVAPCNFNQLQCWWYPAFFYGAYAGGVLIVAKAGSVGGRGMTYLMLCALTICSLIQVQMNMMNILMPVLLSLATIVYVVRTG